MEVLEARCAVCGLAVAITDVGLSKNRFVVKSPTDLCIQPKRAGELPTEAACPHLARALDARIEELRERHS
jgi:hypothetical protein